MKATTTGPNNNQSAALADLAAVTMPPGFGSVLSGIESSLAAAQQVIDQSLAQSDELIKASRQQVYQWQQSGEAEAGESKTKTADIAVADELGNDQQQAGKTVERTLDDDEQQAQQAYRQVLAEQKIATQQVAAAAEAAMNVAMANMENNLKTQQQYYQAAVAQQHAEATQQVVQAMNPAQPQQTEPQSTAPQHETNEQAKPATQHKAGE